MDVIVCHVVADRYGTQYSSFPADVDLNSTTRASLYDGTASSSGDSRGSHVVEFASIGCVYSRYFLVAFHLIFTTYDVVFMSCHPVAFPADSAFVAFVALVADSAVAAVSAAIDVAGLPI